MKKTRQTKTNALRRPAEAPFFITSAPYGGGGYLALIANGRKIGDFQASLGFGGIAAF